MRFSNLSENILGQKSKIRLLKALYQTRAPLSGRHLAKICRLNHRTCLLSLKVLEKEGIIKSRSAGKSLLFEMNKENYFVRHALAKLFEAEEHLLENALGKILKTIKRKPIFESLILFGSIAKKEESPDSDVDLAVILKKEEDIKRASQLFEEINQHFINMFGNVLAPYFITCRNLIMKFKKNQPLIREIVKNGRVIFGKSLEELLLSD